MPLFKEPRFDAGLEQNSAQLRLQAPRGRYNISPTPYVLPLLGAVLAVLFAGYVLTRPSPAELLRNKATPLVPQQAPTSTVEVDLE